MSESNGRLNFALSIGSAIDNQTRDTDFQTVVSEVLGETWRQPVERIRDAYAHNDAILGDRLKRNLPAVLWSGTFFKRTADALKQHSGLVHVDLDGLGDTRESWRDLICADPHTLFCMTSPSGTGLKVVYRCDPARPHLDSFRAAERHCLENFGLVADPACKDVNRMCFMSWDPEAFVNLHAEPLTYPPERVEFKAPEEKSQVRAGISGQTPGDDYNQRGDWQSILKKHGWKPFRSDYWTRPGKETGVSASWNKSSHYPDRFYVLSSNAPPFKDAHFYQPWHIFALLECGGDFPGAARQLGELGYGEQRKNPKPALKSEPSAVEQVYIDAQNESREAADARRREAYNKRQIESSLLGDPKIEPPPEPTPAEKRAQALKDLRARCYAHEFNFAVVPPKPLPRFLIKGSQVSTPGNLTSITGQAKTAKSATIDAMVASVVAAAQGNADDCDCLGFTASPPNGMNVVHFDSEQVAFDHDQLIRRSLRRAKCVDWPKWIRSFCLTGFSIQDRRLLIRLILEDMEAIGGTHSLLLDGAADCIVNVNDADECNPFVTELQNLAIEFKCPIITVIHENPGQDIGKMRGHLGSQIERKAESNLRLKKTDDVITLFSERMRHGLILEKDGPQFSWDTEAAMHLSRIRGLSSKDIAKRDKLCDLLEATFHHAGRDRLRYGELIKAISEVAGVGASRSEIRYAEMKNFNLIAKDLVGFWAPTVTKG